VTANETPDRGAMRRENSSAKHDSFFRTEDGYLQLVYDNDVDEAYIRV